MSPRNGVVSGVDGGVEGRGDDHRGSEPFENEIRIPERYGVEQAIGDTLGPGGVFRGLRTIPTILEIARDMEDVCPDALLLNYTNPMAIASAVWGTL